jgi:tetratricopeptide (TPR) repeat protein
LQRELQRQPSALLEWSHLLLANRNQAGGTPLSSVAGYLEPLPVVRESAVLTEKLGDLYWAQSKFTDALDTWEAALRRKPSPQQKIRLLLTLAEKRSVVGPDAKAFDFYQRVLKEHPDYPDPLKVYQGLLPVVKRMGQKDEIEKCETEIRRLSPPPPPANGTPKP